MRSDLPQPIRLADYRPPAFLVDEIALDFDLQPSATRVRSRLHLRRNPEAADATGPLVLNGEGLTLEAISLDGRPLAATEYSVDAEGLTVRSAPEAGVLETVVVIDPAANTSLDGLYMSGGRFCTQCEAEGFRKITYFPDRPDVLSRYTVRMEADAGFQRLLSNGNLVEEGDAPNGRRYAVWNDPFPKPCYLFALVAGTLDVLEDGFVTMSGRQVALRVYTDPGQSARGAYAMDALKRSMRWDETAFGREYDLDLFMIVAVRDFNAGAMENKGLNIFNSSLLLADPATATDFDYERIESVVAHEYFHNWTGNRITCRDWFQLCLKEGLTVFRDQAFSGDQRGAAVQRIKDVRALRARQFPEDAGPLAHPVRPDSYLKIDNFYTSTTYEKGAELVRLVRTLIGEDAFRAGMDLYFEREDGKAATVEAFVQCFADASGRDLTDVFAWWRQAGTPRLTVAERYDADAQVLELDLSQETRPTPGEPNKRPLPIPVAFGLLNDNGAVMRDTEVVVLDGAQRTVRVEGVASRPVLSALRGFSAPVRLLTETSDADRDVLLAADPDLFNRWEAGQQLAQKLLEARIRGAADEAGEQRFVAAVGRALDDSLSEPAFKALLLAMPNEADLAQLILPADPAAIHRAREALKRALGAGLRERLEALHDGLAAGHFSPDAASAGRRSLRNAALDLLATLGPDAGLARAERQFAEADNMTDELAALNALLVLGGEPFSRAADAFYAKWRHEPLVVDKWFGVRARSWANDAVAQVAALTAHEAFDPKNPNRLRALVLGFAQGNPYRFHQADGAGHRFLADQIIAEDRINASVAARMVEPLGGWKRYREDLGASMKRELERVAAAPGLSKNVSELVGKALV